MYQHSKFIAETRRVDHSQTHRADATHGAIVVARFIAVDQPACVARHRSPSLEYAVACRKHMTVRALAVSNDPVSVARELLQRALLRGILDRAGADGAQPRQRVLRRR